jgi:penicillin G amidase
VRYLLDLNAPTLHVAGANRPISPGVSLGHNDWIGFAHTSFPVDQKDLYVYELNRANPDQYKYQGQWESFRVVREQIKVKNQPAVDIALKFTRHGPVIYVEKEKNRAFAVRSVWLEPGASPYFPSYEHMRSKTFEDYKKSVERWGTPSLNHVYADVQGNIGWAPRGFAPIRPNWDGLLPVPGDGRYEWAGHLIGDQFPTSYNPPSGYITTSNEMNLPPDYPRRKARTNRNQPEASGSEVQAFFKGIQVAQCARQLLALKLISSAPRPSWSPNATAQARRSWYPQPRRTGCRPPLRHTGSLPLP